MDKISNKLYYVTGKRRAERLEKNGIEIASVLCTDDGIAQNIIEEIVMRDSYAKQSNIDRQPDELAVLEIDTSCLKRAMQDSAKNRKDYMPAYLDYIVPPIPADYIKKAELTSTNELGMKVYFGMLNMKGNVTTMREMEEVVMGMRTLPGLGISTEEHIEAEVQTALSLAREGRFNELGNEEEERETICMNSNDFTQAVESIGMDNDNLLNK